MDTISASLLTITISEAFFNFYYSDNTAMIGMGRIESTLFYLWHSLALDALKRRELFYVKTREVRESSECHFLVNRLEVRHLKLHNLYSFMPSRLLAYTLHY